MNNSKKYAKLIYKPKGNKNEIKILNDYKGMGFIRYNNFLREFDNIISLNLLNAYFSKNNNKENKPIPLIILLNYIYKNLIKEIKLLDNLFQKNKKLKHDLIVYRGIPLDDKIKETLSNFEKNGTWLEKGIMSTSISSQFSYLFAAKHNLNKTENLVLLEIKVPRGTPYLSLGWDANKPNKEIIKFSEFELLLPRNCILHFDGKEIKDYYFKITFENVLKDKKYKVLTYKCHLEYDKSLNLPDEKTFLSNTKFQAFNYDFQNILISPPTTNTSS
jgi:hypothetical protein